MFGENMSSRVSLKELFLLFFKIGGITLGGGYVMMPIMKEEIVDKRQWIEAEEFIDILSIAQSFPGALAVNASIYIGYKLRAKMGAFVSCLGVILPPFFIILLASAFLLKFRENKLVRGFFGGVRPAVSALVVVAVLRLSKNLEKTRFSFVLALGAFVSVSFLNLHPAVVIITSGSIGIIYLRKRKEDINEDLD